MIVFDKFNPIKKTIHSTKEQYLKATEKIPTLKNLILVYKHAEQENRFGSESKTVTEKDKAFIRALIDGDTKLFETLGKEIVNYCDAILNEKCTYTRDPKYKNMIPFFDALFDELKKDGLVLYKYLPDLVTLEHEVEHRHQEQRYECAGRKAAHDYLAQRRIDLRAFACGDCHRHDA